MFRIPSRLHASIDYGVVLFLLFSPAFFDLPPATANFTYALGIIHLLLTALTNFELGILHVIPFRIHGIIELVVSISLVGVAFYLGDLEGSLPKIFYLTFAGAVFLVWLLTDYKSDVRRRVV
ncbi:hypothetical protein [Flavobacterium silvaticum]|uniref:Uncharacterized protein n=1 Tax=Flavobacterium silvaticum TaxID=1852020 RepID=A0A972FIW4_9FLAO|nr:hypothetical protein [Flavobacterium silvaticum]NMH26791.1 hypothetical protein [Flavobacterium silvaticum]